MKAAIVCSHGGHLTEFLYMLPHLKINNHFFMTYKSERTENLKDRKYLFPNFGKHPFLSILYGLKIFKILLKERPNIIISNGAEIAIPVFIIAKLLFIKTLFIECYTRVDKPTRTGKIVYNLSNKFFVLWPDMLDRYGKKAVYINSFFNSIKIEKSKRSIKKVTVITGTHYMGFDRLVKHIDNLNKHGEFKIEIQIGESKYIPKNCHHFRYMPYKDLIDMVKKSDLIISQGAMSAIDSLLLSKPTIVVPRLKKYDEVIDDHQLIFSRKLESKFGIQIYINEKDLKDFSEIENQNTLILNEDFLNILRKEIYSLSGE